MSFIVAERQLRVGSETGAPETDGNCEMTVIVFSSFAFHLALFC